MDILLRQRVQPATDGYDRDLPHRFPTIRLCDLATLGKVGERRRPPGVNETKGTRNLSWLARIVQRSKHIDDRVISVAGLDQGGIAEAHDTGPPSWTDEPRSANDRRGAWLESSLIGSQGAPQLSHPIGDQ